MACGLPVIAADVWGVNNMIVNGQNGILYKSEDDIQLAAAISNLIEEPVKREALAKRARNFAEQNYSNIAMAEKYRSLFNDLVK
jgi:glycosyltransferase involved in cell wall biosynthesis